MSSQIKNYRFLTEHFPTFSPVLRTMTLTQGFGKNNVDFYKKLGMIGHNGLDYRAAIGVQTFSAIHGEASYASTDGTGGKSVRVLSDPVDIGGIQYKLETIHYHLDSYEVRKGQKIKAGDIIGKTGNTGKYTTGPHLHFGLKVLWSDNNWKTWNKDYLNGFRGAIDPTPFFENAEARPVDNRYSRPISWVAEFNMRFKNRWLHLKFYNDLNRHPLSITDRELKALVYGGWDYETVFKRPEMWEIWTQYKKADYLTK